MFFTNVLILSRRVYYDCTWKNNDNVGHFRAHSRHVLPVYKLKKCLIRGQKALQTVLEFLRISDLERFNQPRVMLLCNIDAWVTQEATGGENIARCHIVPCPCRLSERVGRRIINPCSSQHIFHPVIDHINCEREGAIINLSPSVKHCSQAVQ